MSRGFYQGTDSNFCRQKVAQVDKRKGNMVSAEPIDNFTVKADQQGAEFVYPGETPFAGETPLVHLGIEQTFVTSLRLLPMALVFRYVGDQVIIEADLASVAGIKEYHPTDGEFFVNKPWTNLLISYQ